MVHVPTRGEVPVRLGPEVEPLIPPIGPTTMSRDVYTDPVRERSAAGRTASAFESRAGTPHVVRVDG